MLMLACIIFIAIILVALIIGGIGFILTGGIGLLMAMLDVLLGGFILWIPIRVFRKKKKEKEEAKKE